MGIKLGKSGDTLVEYPVVNQSIQMDRFQIAGRSIDKTLQEYLFKEKIDVALEMDFIPDTTWRTLDFLLANRSSIKPGMIFVPIPYQDDSELNFTGITKPSTTHKVFFDTITTGAALPIPSAFTSEISSANYTAIASNDTSSIILYPSVGDQNLFLMTFDLNNFITAHSEEEIRRFTLSFIGMRSSPIKFHIFDNTDSKYYLIKNHRHLDSTDFSDALFNNNKQLISSFSLPYGFSSIKDRFIDTNNEVHFLCEGPDNANLMIQHLRLFVNGYHVTTEGDLSFNFRDTFTGTGRRTTLNLIEL